MTDKIHPDWPFPERRHRARESALDTCAQWSVAQETRHPPDAARREPAPTPSADAKED
jgi:hypothetical protein